MAGVFRDPVMDSGRSMIKIRRNESLIRGATGVRHRSLPVALINRPMTRRTCRIGITHRLSIRIVLRIEAAFVRRRTCKDRLPQGRHTRPSQSTQRNENAKGKWFDPQHSPSIPAQQIFPLRYLLLLHRKLHIGHEKLSAEALEQKLAHAFATFQSYRKTSFAERAQWLSNAARVLEDSKPEYGRIMTVEMGKTLKSAVAEAEKCASACRYYAENGERYLADEAIATNASRSFVRYQPIGPVLAVTPWNFPFWQVFRFAAPALMEGNVGLLKHSSNVPQCALAIEDILRRAGFPDGAFQTL